MRNFPLFTALICGVAFCATSSIAADIKGSSPQSINAGSSTEYSQPQGYKSVFPWHAPMGKGIGAKPGRVVWAYAPESVHWDVGNWWEPKNFDQKAVHNMVKNGISNLSGDATAKEGWNALFIANNEARGKGSVGYKPGEKIAVKVNMNGAGWYKVNDGTTRKSFSNPVVVRELILSLVEDGGVRPEDITIYDVSRNIPGYMVRHIHAAPLQNVNFKYADEGGPNDTLRDITAPIVWSKEFKGEVGYVPKVVTEAEYLINFATLKGHSMNGITLTAKNHFGSIHNSHRGAPPVAAGLHPFVWPNKMNEYSPLVDLWGNKNFGPKTVLYVLEGLLSPETESAVMNIDKDNVFWKQPPFNGKFTASIFFSQDPVAIDSVGADFLMNEPTMQRLNPRLRNNRSVENY
ncbi:MAG: DUF362 domain-containing protein, partial [Burkholderiales bacterium]|nr:DUF362 domain-containing protein [Burkholderiales bacterium]